MDENATHDIVQCFRFDCFKAKEEEWEHYIQWFKTELAPHRLLDGGNAADMEKPTALKGRTKSV